MGFSLGQISAALQLCALFAGLWLRQPYVNVQVCPGRTHGQIPKNFVSRDLRRFVVSAQRASELCTSTNRKASIVSMGAMPFGRSLPEQAC